MATRLFAAPLGGGARTSGAGSILLPQASTTRGKRSIPSNRALNAGLRAQDTQGRRARRR